jgi:predicted phosphodiesterase
VPNFASLGAPPVVPDIKNLGNLTKPLLVFGGPYSNLQATTALFEQAAGMGIPAEQIICTGDVVAYCAAPVETTDLIRQSGIHVVQGNCEVSLGEDADNCGCGFDEGSTCDRLSAQWFDYARQQLDPASAKWMADLPAQIRFEMTGRTFAVVHGAPSAINRFVFPSTDAGEKQREILSTGCDGVIGGHSGLPFTQEIDGLLWHNAGVIGLPANDGTPRTWFSLIRPEADGIRIEHHTLDYDADAAARDMRLAGLAEEYARTLTSGLWDNCDILPQTEARAQGKSLFLSPYLWRICREAAE